MSSSKKSTNTKIAAEAKAKAEEQVMYHLSELLKGVCLGGMDRLVQKGIVADREAYTSYITTRAARFVAGEDPSATVADGGSEEAEAEAPAEAEEVQPAYILEGAVAKKKTLLVPEGTDWSEAVQGITTKLTNITAISGCKGYHFAPANLDKVKDALQTMGIPVMETTVAWYLEKVGPAAKPAKEVAAKPKPAAKEVPAKPAAKPAKPKEDVIVEEDEDEEDSFVPQEDGDEDVEDEEGDAVDGDEGDEDEDEEEEPFKISHANAQGTRTADIKGVTYAFAKVGDEYLCVGRMSEEAKVKVKGYIGCVPLTATESKKLIQGGYPVFSKKDAKKLSAAEVKGLTAAKFL